MNAASARAVQQLAATGRLPALTAIDIAYEAVTAQVHEAASMGLLWTFARCQAVDPAAIYDRLTAGGFAAEYVFRSASYNVLLIRW